MSDFQIRPLAAEEITSAATLFAMQLAEHDVQRSQAELVSPLTTLLAEPANGFVLLAVAGQNPIGAAYAARILSLEHGGWMGWLDELYVVPAWRNRGVGSALLEATIAGATARSWGALDLELDSDHERVVPLYQRNQFHPLHRIRFVRRLRSS